MDEHFGERLEHLPAREPVWIVESPANTPVVKRLWAERPQDNHLTGITLFRAGAESREALLLGILGPVDLHHGEYSADPPYPELEVYGVGLSEEIGEALREFEFATFRPTAEGFVAARGQAVAH